MSEVQRLITRTWSAIESKGERATAEAIAEHVGLDVDLVRRHLVELRAKGQLP